jgi:hypothetical protein
VARFRPAAFDPEWAMRQDCWGGKPNGEKLAQGILFAPLGVLAGHYG